MFLVTKCFFKKKWEKFSRDTDAKGVAGRLALEQRIDVRRIVTTASAGPVDSRLHPRRDIWLIF